MLERIELEVKNQKEKLKKMHNYKKQGKLNRASGKRFELKVRADLESEGWIVFRNSNDLKDNKFKQTTGHWNPFTKTIIVSQSGFPDFICIHQGNKDCAPNILPHVKFFECKTNRQLSPIEKEKCEWIEKNLYIEVHIASKGEIRGEIIYRRWNE